MKTLDSQLCQLKGKDTKRGPQCSFLLSQMPLPKSQANRKLLICRLQLKIQTRQLSCDKAENGIDVDRIDTFHDKNNYRNNQRVGGVLLTGPEGDSESLQWEYVPAKPRIIMWVI